MWAHPFLTKMSKHHMWKGARIHVHDHHSMSCLHDQVEARLELLRNQYFYSTISTFKTWRPL